MSLIKKNRLSVFAVLCLAAGAIALCACSPEAEVLIPTERLEIRGIPLKILNTQTGKRTEKNTFKVYAQLSQGTDVEDGAVAEGTAFFEDGVVSDSTFTVTIDLHTRFHEDVDYKDTNWNNLAILLSPNNPVNIFEMNVKGHMGGPSSSSSTVVLNWGSMLPLKDLTSIESYMALFGYPEDPPGIGLILDDEDLEGNTAVKPDPLNPGQYTGDREAPDETAQELHGSDKLTWDDFNTTG